MLPDWPLLTGDRRRSDRRCRRSRDRVRKAGGDGVAAVGVPLDPIDQAMLPQFIDEDPRILAVVYGDRDQLHAALLKSPLERRHQPLGGLDPGTARVMSAREQNRTIGAD